MDIIDLNKYLEVDREAIGALLAVEITARRANYRAEDDGTDMLPISTQHIMNALAKHSVAPKEIWLTGGEPTLNTYLCEIATMLSQIQESSYITIITDGIKLREEEYAERVVACKAIKEVNVTLNSGKPYVHNMMVADVNATSTEVEEMQAFELTILGIAELSKARKRAKRSDLSITVKVNISEDRDLYRIVRVVESQGGKVDKIVLRSPKYSIGQACATSRGRMISEWQRPTDSMIAGYFGQARSLISTGKISGAKLIDPLPAEIVERLKLEGNPMYAPIKTPTIDAFNQLWADVVN